jgi:GNAT superfamily N-acetyltransferase
MPQVYEAFRNNFLISTDPARLDHEAMASMLNRSYWASGRPRPRTERALQNSLVFGLYDGPHQVGMARVVTDYSVVAYLCDVFIEDEYRGQGLGQWLLEKVFDHPDLRDMRRWLLTTDDAHDLYRKFGFVLMSHAENWMERIRPFSEEG